MSFRGIDQLIGDVQEVFSCVDFDAVLKPTFSHRHPDPIKMTDSLMERIEEVPVYVCKIMTMRSMDTVTLFMCRPLPNFLMNFGLY